MKTFHGSQKIKTEYVQRLKQHKKAEQIIQGTYWKEGKGCALGCLMHSKKPHKQAEKELGIPQELCCLADTIFEKLPINKARRFAVEWVEAVPVGKDLTKIKHLFFIQLLQRRRKELRKLDVEEELFKKIDTVIERVVLLHKKALTTTVQESEWKSARSVARSVARSAVCSARSAVCSARSVAWSVARSAVCSARSAESVARSAESAARSAVWSTESAGWSAEWEWIRKTFLKILKQGGGLSE